MPYHQVKLVTGAVRNFEPHYRILVPFPLMQRQVHLFFINIDMFTGRRD